MKRSLFVAIVINICITSFEIAIGVLIGSLALISDAVHNFSDVGSLALCWWGERIKDKAKDVNKTYGYKRAEILIALFNSLVLLAVLVFILIESIERLLYPAPIQSGYMIAIALFALIGNGIATYLLEKGAHQNLNLKSAWLHSLQDALFSLGVVCGSVLIYFTDWYIIDPLISIALSLVLLREAYQLIRQTTDILMESVPVDIDLMVVRSEIESLTGAGSIHDLHVWQTGSDDRFLSAHVGIGSADDATRSGFLADIQKLLCLKFSITHSTIQLDVIGDTGSSQSECSHCN